MAPPPPPGMGPPLPPEGLPPGWTVDNGITTVQSTSGAENSNSSIELLITPSRRCGREDPGGAR